MNIKHPVLISSSQTESGSVTFLLLILVTLLGALLLIPSMYSSSCADPVSSEPRQYISSMNRAQQAYFLEKNNFANSIDGLGLGLRSETYRYFIEVQPKHPYSADPLRPSNSAVFSYGVLKKSHVIFQPQRDAYSYIGAVFLIPNPDLKTDKTDSTTPTYTTTSILCHSLVRTPNPTLNKPLLKEGEPVCSEGTEKER